MEDKALKDLHPLYRAWCSDDGPEDYDPDAIAEFKNGGYDVKDR